MKKLVSFIIVLLCSLAFTVTSASALSFGSYNNLETFIQFKNKVIVEEPEWVVPENTIKFKTWRQILKSHTSLMSKAEITDTFFLGNSKLYKKYRKKNKKKSNKWMEKKFTFWAYDAPPTFQAPFESVFTSSQTLTRRPPDVNPVPEPATIMLFGIGLIGMAGLNRKKFQE